MTSKKGAKENKIIEESLQAIYGEEKVDFSKLDRSKNRLTGILLTIVITLFIITTVAWSGFFVYTKYFTSIDEDIFILEIETNQEIVSGSKTKLTIHYKNPTDIPLAKLQIEAKLPPAFNILAATPAPTSLEELIWDIGLLNANSDGAIVIEGIWIANVPSTTPVQAFANFRPANFNSDFQEITTIYLTSTESNLTATFEGSEEGRPGEELNYTFIIENKGEEEIQNIKTTLELPTGFFLEASIPEIESGTTPEWTIETLAPGSTEEINFTGTFAADTEGFQYFNVVVSIINGNRKLLQTKTEGFTDVVGDNLSLQLVANGSIEEIGVEIGSKMRVSLAVENTGESDIEDLSLILDFVSDLPLPIEWSNSELGGGVTTRDGVVWSSKDLGLLASGEKKIFTLVFPINSTVTNLQADQFDIVVRANVDGFKIKSKPISISINSEADFAVEARYFTDEGAPLGSGPLPPKVGETTNYRVFWKLENQLHDLENIKIQAILPPHAVWTNRFDTDLGNIKFDETNRSVTWTIVELPKDITEIEATFAVSITPDENDVGKFVKLISGSTMTLKDKKTGESITESSESLTTELPNDEFASGKGTVVK